MYAIAIDGPSGAGKSTIAKKLSELLEIEYLDTGAMYRALAYSAIQKGIDISHPDFEEFLNQFQLKMCENKIFVNGEEISGKIRTNEISMAASKISAHPKVREKLIDLQRRIAQEQSIILDGRDIGTVVLPRAKYKFFVTATPETRARRRMEQTGDRDYNEVLKQITIRDHQDTTRTISPLQCAEDAMVIDTTNETVRQSLERLMKIIDEEKA